MPKLMAVATLALLLTASAHADDGEGNGEFGATCANLLHYYPTTAPLNLAIRGEGMRVALVCQPESTQSPIWLTFATASDLAWWRDHTDNSRADDDYGEAGKP